MPRRLNTDVTAVKVTSQDGWDSLVESYPAALVRDGEYLSAVLPNAGSVRLFPGQYVILDPVGYASRVVDSDQLDTLYPESE